MEDNNPFEEPIEGWDIPFEPSGLICETCGYNDSLKCFIDLPVEDDAPADYIYCGKHAAENGFCCGCGLHCAGMTSFEFHHPGFCDNCWDEVSSNDDDEGDFDGDFNGPYPIGTEFLDGDY